MNQSLPASNEIRLRFYFDVNSFSGDVGDHLRMLALINTTIWATFSGVPIFKSAEGYNIYADLMIKIHMKNRVYEKIF